MVPFSQGINIRNLHNIIFAHPSKSRIRNLQSVGRGLRKAADQPGRRNADHIQHHRNLRRYRHGALWYEIFTRQSRTNRRLRRGDV